MFAKPYTAAVSPAVRTLMLGAVPLSAKEHLLHAWDAISAAIRGPRETEAAHIGYAKHRLACARSEPVARGVKPAERAAYVAECASLEAALADYLL